MDAATALAAQQQAYDAQLKQQMFLTDAEQRAANLLASQQNTYYQQANGMLGGGNAAATAGTLWDIGKDIYNWMK
jgi:hypothetical protein